MSRDFSERLAGYFVVANMADTDYEERLGDPAPLFFSATLTSLRHDKVRLSKLELYEVVSATLRVGVSDRRGQSLATVDHAVTFRFREGSDDPLAAVAKHMLAATIDAKPVRALLEGRQRLDHRRPWS